MDLLTVPNITFVIGLVGILFTTYNKLTGPQISADKTDALLVQQLSVLQKDVANLRDNHVHTLDTKLDATNEALNKLTIDVAKLAVIMDERLPAKKKK